MLCVWGKIEPENMLQNLLYVIERSGENLIILFFMIFVYEFNMIVICLNSETNNPRNKFTGIFSTLRIAE